MRLPMHIIGELSRFSINWEPGRLSSSDGGVVTFRWKDVMK